MIWKSTLKQLMQERRGISILYKQINDPHSSLSEKSAGRGPLRRERRHLRVGKVSMYVRDHLVPVTVPQVHDSSM